MIKDLGRVVGKSAYEIACDNGFVGSESEWLESLDGSNYDDTELKALIETKVDKENGKVLSDNNFSDEEKTKLAELNNYDDTQLQNQITQEIADRKSADTTIQNSISTTVNNAIAEIVANSPADFDTLKEIADWIDTHEDSASAMNTAIQENKNALNKKQDKGTTLSTLYNYSDNKIRYYWYKILNGSDFANSKYTKLKITTSSDENYAYDAEYVLDVGYYASTTNKCLSVGLANLYKSNLNQANLCVAIDKDFNVYLQAKCEWSSYCYIEKVAGNVDFITTRLNYIEFKTDPSDFVSVKKITDTENCRLLKNISTNEITVTSGSNYIQAIATKSVADKNGNDITTTYATKSLLDTTTSGLLNQVAMTLNNYVSKSNNANNVMESGSKLDFKTNKAEIILPVYEANETTPTTEGSLYIKKGSSGDFHNTTGNGTYMNSKGYTFEYSYRVSSDGFAQIWGTVKNANTVKYKSDWIPSSFQLPFTMANNKYVVEITNEVYNVNVAGAEYYIKNKTTQAFEFAMYNRNTETSMNGNTANIYICGLVA